MQVKLNRTELEEAITDFVLNKVTRQIVQVEGAPHHPAVEKVTIHDGGTGATAEVEFCPTPDKGEADDVS